jgi:hypothetical protein
VRHARIVALDDAGHVPVPMPLHLATASRWDDGIRRCRDGAACSRFHIRRQRANVVRASFAARPVALLRGAATRDWLERHSVVNTRGTRDNVLRGELPRQDSNLRPVA